MASAMPVIVYPPGEDGGRRVRLGDHFVGMAYRVLDIAAFVQEAGLQDWDDTRCSREPSLPGRCC
ncbi:hypothetical protein AQJ84_28810 [Streptomyces resistomycificus]|uniref:Uncharacterized protein n=1 Tax=Streptomyces resistomycificus TaxID=67356 RepID=A0A0L8L6C7_9ACTN|nr:hypothetical protein ADK37_21530 [Streptomyces resistomycificus]KUN93923.1 hypothetical protein AQJ84_28810 [Streptomyces resistomycificus]